MKILKVEWINNRIKITAQRGIFRKRTEVYVNDGNFWINTESGKSVSMFGGYETPLNNAARSYFINKSLE